MECPDVDQARSLGPGAESAGVIECYMDEGLT